MKTNPGLSVNDDQLFWWWKLEQFFSFMSAKSVWDGSNYFILRNKLLSMLSNSFSLCEKISQHYKQPLHKIRKKLRAFVQFILFKE